MCLFLVDGWLIILSLHLLLLILFWGMVKITVCSFLAEALQEKLAVLTVLSQVDKWAFFFFA